jgi:hypothetical protein
VEKIYRRQIQFADSVNPPIEIPKQSSADNYRAAERLLLVACLSLCACVIVYGSLSVVHEQQYVRLAESFLAGKLYFITVPEHWHDTAAYSGRYYWPLGPLPAVLLMPFVVLSQSAGLVVFQSYLSLPLSLLTGWLCFRLARNCGRSIDESMWFVLAFCGASSYLSVATISMSWPLAQVVAIFLLFLALNEWMKSQRWWLMGLLLGLTSAARLSAGLNIVLLVGAAMIYARKDKIDKLVSLAAGFVIPIFFLCIYNYARFGSVVETGYSYQLPAPEDFAATSLTNVMPHLRVFLFGMPTVSDEFPFFGTNPAGMSVLLLSPWLLYIASLKIERFSFVGLANCAVVLVAVLSWRSTGQLQVGYRFLLDFLPVITLLLARTGFRGKKVPLGFKVLTALGFVSTLYFLVSFIDRLPQG